MSEATTTPSTTEEHPLPYDYEDTAKTLDVMFDDGDTMELRVICKPVNKYAKIYNLFFTDKAAMLAAVRRYDADKTVGGIYTILNKIDPEKRKVSTTPGTKTDDISHRRKLILDFDAIKPPGVPPTCSSTDVEKAETIDRAGDCVEWLHNHGITQEPLWGDSGNGTHVIYAIDLPVDISSYDLLSAFYDRLNQEGFAVDVSLKDAPRVCKLYGTVA
jgi:hypothetical protein